MCNTCSPVTYKCNTCEFKWQTSLTCLCLHKYLFYIVLYSFYIYIEHQVEQRSGFEGVNPPKQTVGAGTNLRQKEQTFPALVWTIQSFFSFADCCCAAAAVRRWSPLQVWSETFNTQFSRAGRAFSIDSTSNSYMIRGSLGINIICIYTVILNLKGHVIY